MKFSVSQRELADALSVVMKGISARATNPLLAGVLISAEGDSVVLQSTNLELSARYRATALVEEEGGAVLPGRLLFNIVKNLPDATVALAAGSGTCRISCEDASFSLITLPAEDFPSFPLIDVQQSVELPAEVFISMIKQVARVVSRDESRATLTGVLITLEETTLKMVATDSYRLAVCEKQLENAPSSESFSAVISGSFLNDVAGTSGLGSTVSLALSQNQIIVSGAACEFVHRRIEGSFPNYRRLLPDSFGMQAHVDLERLTAAIKRIALVGSSSLPVRFAFDADNQNLTLSGGTADVGSAQEVLPCTVSGQSCTIAFNSSYVLEGLSVIEGAEVLVQLQSSLRSGIFRAQGEQNYLYLCMPVRL